MKPTCGCCEGVEAVTPLPVASRPGLSALAYRVGTHAAFLESMLARLSAPAPDDPDGGGSPYPLRALTTRDPGDPSIALLDAWATVADVLTFYQERLANEGYLRTATERRSLLELARLVGYKLRPGVAASVYLAYSLEDGQAATIPTGSRAQSVPGPGEKMESFETSAALDARGEWNALKPRTVQPQDIIYVPPPPAVRPVEVVRTARTAAPNNVPQDGGGTSLDTVYFKGTAANPKPGDRLLFVFNEGTVQEATAARVVSQAAVEAPQGRTRVDLQPPAAPPAGGKASGASGAGMAPGDFLGTLLSQTDFATLPPAPPPRLDADLGSAFGLGATRNGAGALTGSRAALLLDLRPDSDPGLLRAALENAVVAPSPAVKVYALRKKAYVYGNNAPATAGAQPGVNADETITIHWTVVPAAGGQPNQLRVDQMTVAGVSSPVLQRELKQETFTMTLPNEAVVVTVLDADPANLKMQFQFLRRKATVTASVPDQTATGQVDGNRNEIVTSKSFPAGGFNFTAVLHFITEQADWISLDAVYDQVVAGAWLVIERPPKNDDSDDNPDRLVRRVKKVNQLTRTEYGVTAKVTKAQLDHDWLRTGTDDFSVIRLTTVYAQSEPLELAAAPVDLDLNPVKGKTIELDGFYDGLQPGRWLIVTGERILQKKGTKDGNNPDPNFAEGGVIGTELVLLQGVEQRADTTILVPSQGTAKAPALPADNPLPSDKLHSFLTLANPLAYVYKRDTVTILGNVVKVTHGQTCTGSGPPANGGPPQEVLGSGDGTKPLQAFSLRQSPLTFVAAATTTGAQTTLQVRVNDVLWAEADSLAGQGPADRVYVTRTDDQDKTTVQFGDGVNGARLPTGTENVKATYRFGIGAEGNVRAGQISLLATRPLGVKGVTNPLAATGGADREGIDEARDNAPRGLSFLGRLVSVQDYEDFARASAGIGKARAIPGADPDGRPAVSVVVGGSGDIPIDTTSELFLNLQQSLTDFGDPALTVLLHVRRRLALLIQASFAANPNNLWDDVAANVRAALLDAFGFERRDFGQAAYPSEVIRAIQDVEGVAAVYLERFCGVDDQALALPPSPPAPPSVPAAEAVAPPPPPGPAAGCGAPAPVRPQWDQIAYLSPAVDSTLILKVLPT